jgi:glycosyltransferase involved in cell wall biosynthesis
MPADTAPGAAARSAGDLPRVLYAAVLDPQWKFGSLEEQILELARAFRDRGSLFLPVFICDEGLPVTAEFAAAGIQTRCVDLRLARLGPLTRLVRLIRDNRIDVIHWNFTLPVGNPYLWLLALLAPGVTHCLTDHNSRSLPLRPPRGGLRRFLKLLLLKRYRRVFCVSESVLDCLKSEGCWSNLDRSIHFVNAHRFRPDLDARNRIRRELGDGACFVLVTVAHLIREKGIHVAVRALASCPRSCVLWIVGGGPESDSLRNFACEMRVEDRVRFLGLQQHVEPYLQAADCFLCPSLWAEAAGLVNLEAQSCGLPVVASDIGGIPELVSNGRTGLLFPPGDHQALAERVCRLEADPSACRLMGEQARVRVVEHFSVERTLESHLESYRRFARRR